VCAADGDRGAVVINSTHWGSRQRFTLAHEVGHWVLGDVSAGARADRDVFAQTDDAVSDGPNAFAAALLVADQGGRGACARRQSRGCQGRVPIWRELQDPRLAGQERDRETDLSRYLREVQPFEAAVEASEGSSKGQG